MPGEQPKIVISDQVSDRGLQPLRDAGFAVEQRTGASDDELRAALGDCAGLIVRREGEKTDSQIFLLWKTCKLFPKIKERSIGFRG